MDTRQRIIDAASRLFADLGYTQTHVRDVAKAAEANVSSVNYAFGSKDLLYLRCCKDALSACDELPEFSALLADLQKFRASADWRVRLLINEALIPFAGADFAESLTEKLGEVHHG